MTADSLFPNRQELGLFGNYIGDFYLPMDAPKDGVLNAIKNGEVYQENITDEFAKYVKLDDTVIDLGANVGQMTIALASLVGKKGCVVAVEPDPYLFYVLNKNITHNAFSNCMVFPAAAWSVSGENLPYPEPDLVRFDSLGSYGITPKSTTDRTVLSLAIDDLGLENVSLIKLDIQGSELEALKGLRETIDRCKPAILMEYETLFNEDFSVTWVDYEKFIEDIGYEIINWITPENFVMVSK